MTPHGTALGRRQAGTVIDANAAATAARSSGQACLDEAQLAAIRARYRGAVAKGITGNQRKRTQIGKDGLRLARRFRACEDMILRFAHRPDRRVHLESGRAGRPPGQSADAHFRRLLAHPGLAWPTSPSSSPTCPPPVEWGIDALDALTPALHRPALAAAAVPRLPNHRGHARHPAERLSRPCARRRAASRHPYPGSRSQQRFRHAVIQAE